MIVRKQKNLAVLLLTTPAFYLRDFFLIAFFFSVFSCSNKDGSDAVQKENDIPGNFLTAYQEARDCRFSHEHDLNHIKVFCAPDACESYLGQASPYPIGAKLIKVEYSDEKCENVRRFTYMKKMKTGTDSELGDWDWKEFDADKKPRDIPDILNSCVFCHRNHCPEPPLGYDYACGEELQDNAVDP